jgi:hypothetical protein
LNVDPGCRLLARGPFLPGAVATRVVAQVRPSTPALDAHIETAWRSAVERAARDGHELFDGDVLRWIEGRVRERGGRRELEMTVAPAKYREFVGTNLDPTLRARLDGEAHGPTPTEAVAAAAATVHPWTHFANAVGTSAVVVTSDERLVAGRRSARVLGYAGCVHAFGGMLEASDAAADPATSGAVDAFGGLARELTEELGVAAGEISEPVLEGVILEPQIWQPELIFHARVARTFAGLVDAWRGAPHRAEHDDLVTFPLAPADPEAELRRAAPVSPIGRAALALYWSRRGG